MDRSDVNYHSNNSFPEARTADVIIHVRRIINRKLSIWWKGGVYSTFMKGVSSVNVFFNALQDGGTSVHLFSAILLIKFDLYISYSTVLYKPSNPPPKTRCRSSGVTLRRGWKKNKSISTYRTRLFAS